MSVLYGSGRMNYDGVVGIGMIVVLYRFLGFDLVMISKAMW